MSLPSFTPAKPAPLISVVIPTHNRPDMLAEALASVRAQTFTDYEIIVVSNGESETARQASREAAAGCVYIALDEGNPAVARNAGVEAARGEWIAFLDDDDLWLPNKLERQIAEAEMVGADLIACDIVKFFPDGQELIEKVRRPDGWTYAKAINHHRWWAVPAAVMVRKSVFAGSGRFNSLQRAHDDTDMWRRVAWRHTVYQMDAALTRYRSGHASIMANERRSLWYDLLHFVQMYWDTPRDLRWALPTVRFFVVPRLIALGPDWLLRLRPRTRLRQLRSRLAGIRLRRDGSPIVHEFHKD